MASTGVQRLNVEKDIRTATCVIITLGAWSGLPAGVLIGSCQEEQQPDDL